MTMSDLEMIARALRSFAHDERTTLAELFATHPSNPTRVAGDATANRADEVAAHFEQLVKQERHKRAKTVDFRIGAPLGAKRAER